MFRKRTLIAVCLFVASISALSNPVLAQGEIQVDGVSVVTTETDKDTTYDAGAGLALESGVFKSTPGRCVRRAQV